MACLDLQTGLFSNLPWMSGTNGSAGGTSVAWSASGVTVTKGSRSTGFLPGDVHYAVYGDMGFVALLFRNTSISDITYTVVMVDFSGTGALSTTGPLFSVTLPNTVSPPRVMQSFGNGRATFFFSGGSGPTPEARNMMICRSETGDVLLAVGGTISGINGQVIAQVTSTDLVINHPNTGSNDDTSAPRPVGSLTVTPVSHDFGEVVLGASTPGLSTATETFTLGNSGNDCVMVNDIGDVAPFALTAASRASLPITLEPGETTTIDVVFSPASTGNNIMRSLPVTRTPAQGASSLECRGDARNAEASISVSRSSISFGTIPHPGTDVESFTITNSGELDVFVTLPASPAGSFSWAPTNVTLPLPVVGASIDVDVTFTTPGDLAATPQMIVVAPTQGASRTVNLSGAGCIANAVPVLPPSAPITFGEIEQGFRTVRIREVRNDGDGDMVVTARILPGADPTHQDLFGLVLPGADITDAPDMRTYTVNPVTRCGPGPVGDGLETIAVSFFADAAPATGPYTAVLELSTPAPGPTITYNLSATIIPAVPVDAVLAFDKSGSMGATVGTRTKIQAARAAGELFIQMLREDAEDRTSIVSFNETPTDDRSIRLVSGNKPDLISALGFTESGFTNVAGAMTLGRDEFSDPPHPSNPPDLKKALVVLTDGVENRCFQDGGSGPWFSITGRDAADGMARPDGTLQDTDPLPTPGGDIVVHAIGIGEPADVDSATLDQIATATGGAFSLAEDLTGDDFFLLEKYYTQVFMETTGLSPISDPFFTIPAGEKQTHEFDIFPGDVNVMVVIYDHPAGRLPFYVISPLGEVFSGSSLPAGFGMRLRSTTTARFVELTFPRGEPKRYATTPTDRWQVVVIHEGRVCFGDINPRRRKRKSDDFNETDNKRDVSDGFLPEKCRDTKDPIRYGIAIGAGSNLRMQAYVEPNQKHIGEPIHLNAVLAEAGLPVTGASVTVTARAPNGAEYSVALKDEGASGDGDANNGDYGGDFLQTYQAGHYQFLFRATGTQAGHPFVRELHRSKVVFSRRKPDDGDTVDDCCEKLLRELRYRREKPSKAKSR